MILINFTVLEKEKHNLQIWRKNFFFFCCLAKKRDFAVLARKRDLRFWREP